MRVFRSTDMTKEQCLHHIAYNQWMLSDCRTPESAGFFWGRLRYWQSLSYLAKPARKAPYRRLLDVADGLLSRLFWKRMGKAIRWKSPTFARWAFAQVLAGKPSSKVMAPDIFPQG